MAEILLHRGCQSRNDPPFRDAAGGCEGGAAEAGEVVAVGAGDTFDDSEVAKAAQLTGEGCWGKMWKQANQVGAAHAVDIELGTLQGAQKPWLGALEEVQSLDRTLRVAPLLGQAVQRPNAGAVIVDGGKELEVAAVAAEQDLAQVDQAVDRLLQRGEFAGAATFAMFHLAVVLEKGHVVHGRLDPEHQADLVVHLHLRLPQTMLDAGALDPGLETRSDFLGELRGDLFAEEGGDLLSFDCQHRLARELLVQGGERLARAEDQVRGVLGLHDAPVISLAKALLDRAALARIAIEHPVQLLGLEGVGELLRALPVLDAYEGVVREGSLDALGFELSGQPAVAIAVKLQPKGTPGRYPQIAQPHHRVHEVEIVVQAFARVGLEEGLVAGLVVPGLVALAGFHRRDHVHQARMIPALLEDLGHHVLFADGSLRMCSISIPAEAASSCARSRIASRSGSAKRG